LGMCVGVPDPILFNPEGRAHSWNLNAETARSIRRSKISSFGQSK
jgi:hypothetical protein